MKKSIFILLASLIFNANSQVIITNLNDKLRTEITLQSPITIDIPRLNRLSIGVDIDKISTIYTPIVPIKIMNKSGIGDIYGVVDNSPISVKLTDMKTRDASLYSFKISDRIKLTDISVDCINTYKLGSLELDKLELANACINSIDINSYSDLGNIVTEYYIDGTTINPDSYSAKVLVVDQSAYKIIVTEDTYRELDELRKIYQFEKEFNKTPSKLADLTRLDHTNYVNWIKVLANNKDCNIEYISYKKRHKLIGELRLEFDQYESEDKLRMYRNLDWLKNKGYDSVLVRYDCTEDINLLTNMISDVKSKGFRVYSVYVGIDGTKWNPFISPDTIESYISVVSPLSDGVFLGWRSTSSHVKLLPGEFFNYLCNLYRKYNDKVLIYGEVYYGQIDPLRTRTLIYNTPKNVTGVVINNMGYVGYNHGYIASKLFSRVVPNYNKFNLIAQVIGYQPYYASRHRMDFDRNTEYSYKLEVENSFIEVRCSTVTMLHDGVDDHQADQYDTTDNIIYDENLIED